MSENDKTDTEKEYFSVHWVQDGKKWEKKSETFQETGVE